MTGRTIGFKVDDNVLAAINDYFLTDNGYATKADFFRDAVMEKIGSKPVAEGMGTNSDDGTIKTITKSLEAINRRLDAITAHGTHACASYGTSRVMMFMDVMNVSLGMDEAKPNTEDRAMIDYIQLKNQLLGDRKLVRAYAFDSAFKDDVKGVSNANFHTMLEYSGWDMVTRQMGAEQKQKEVDMSMGISMLTEADNYDVAIVISGDRDFVPAIEAVKRMGKTVEVASFNQNLSTQMEKTADKVTLLDNLFLIRLKSPGEVSKHSKTAGRKGVTA